MTSLQSLYTDAMFRLTGMTWLEGLDLLLVMSAFYLLLVLIRRSRAGVLLRGALALSAVLLIVTILLPLPTFDWLVRVLLIAILIGTPIIFQPELRRLLEQMGRSTHMGRAVRQTVAEKVISGLMQAIERLTANRTGALMAIEGNDPLYEVLKTGVPFGGQITSELIESIFYPGTPLHDGAVILREDQVVVAGCVLPLTQQELNSHRRLGTRHRAAVGLSEVTDALVIVVSEETGEISVARQGQLQSALNKAELRKHLVNFYLATNDSSPSTGSWRFFSLLKQPFRYRLPIPGLRGLFSYIGLLFVALLLALATWTFVTEQINPAQRFRVDNIELRVVDIPPNTTLMKSPPAMVSAIVQTTANERPTLGQDSFQASVSLKDVKPGLHHLPVQINSGASRVRVLSIDPAVLDLELATVVSRTLPVTVNLPDQKNMSPAYQIAGGPLASPNQVQVVGPAALVEQVSKVETVVSLANAGSSVQETRPLQAVDQEGQEVTGITLEPAQALISVFIHQRSNARDVGVRAIPSGPPPSGYWLSSLIVTPATVTLQGNSDLLAKIGGFVDTLPVDISQAFGDVEMQVPLDLPPEVQALDSNNGKVVGTVTVRAQIAARNGDLVTTQTVELLGTTPGITATVNPSEVDLLLSGPLPKLNQIDTNHSLIRVWVDVGDLAPGESADLTPIISAPDGIEAQLIPPSVLVTLSEPDTFALNEEEDTFMDVR